MLSPVFAMNFDEINANSFALFQTVFRDWEDKITYGDDKVITTPMGQGNPNENGLGDLYFRFMKKFADKVAQVRLIFFL